MGSIVRFLRDSWSELKKVVWPSREETTRLTVTVLIITFAVAGFVAFLDYLFSRMLTFLVGR